MVMELEDLRVDLQAHGQSHLLQGWSDLNEEQKLALYADLRAIDYPLVISYFNRCVKDINVSMSEKENTADDDADLEPLPPHVIGRSVLCNEVELHAYREAGECRVD